MRIAEVLQHATEELHACRTENARLEAELLLCHALGLSREVLYTKLQEELAAVHELSFHDLLHRRLSHEPTPYILGSREFFGLDFEVSPAALIPRPETELLVETAIEWLEQRGLRGKRLHVIDVGTGSGAIAVPLANQIPKLRVIATDISREALELAKRNAARHALQGRIDFVQTSLLAATQGSFDLIVANLPYVPALAYADLPPDIREHEPEVALRGGESGTVLIEELLEEAGDRLPAGGLLLVEHGWDQGERLRDVARHYFPAAGIETRTDLAGIDRVLVVQT